MSMHKGEVLGWILTLPDDSRVGIDAGGLSLVGYEAHHLQGPEVLSDLPYLELGGLPEEIEA